MILGMNNEFGLVFIILDILYVIMMTFRVVEILSNSLNECCNYLSVVSECHQFLPPAFSGWILSIMSQTPGD